MVGMIENPVNHFIELFFDSVNLIDGDIGKT